MSHQRAIKYFGDIVSVDRINAPYTKPKSAVDEQLLEVLWEAFNSRGKRAAAPVEHCATADEYKPMFEEYEEIDIDEALKEVNA